MTSPVKQFVFLIPIVAIGMFLTLIGACIVLYPGGVYTDPTIHGYSWTMNFFSDLGRTKVFNGQSNSLVSMLFTVALSMVGIVFFPFFMVWRTLFKEKKGAGIFASIGTVFGCIAGVAYIVVAFSPWDIHQPVHVPANQAAFFAMMLMSLCYIAAMISRGSYPRMAIIAMTIFALLNVGYLYLLFFGPSYTTPAGLKIQVIGQKTIVFVEVVVMAIQAWLARGLVREKQ